MKVPVQKKTLFLTSRSDKIRYFYFPLKKKITMLHNSILENIYVRSPNATTGQINSESRKTTLFSKILAN
jgi:hypothetical protein